jgi:prevent-host-death family protein
MDAMPISKFKAQCLSAMERVRRTGRPLRVTRYGRPVADVVPAVPAVSATRVLGALSGSTRITGDIVAPAASQSDWNALT